MKTFSQLKKISELYTKTATKIPYNAFVLCNQLQLKYKVKFQYEEDYKDGYNPLNSTPAFLCKNNKGQSLILCKPQIWLQNDNII